MRCTVRPSMACSAPTWPSANAVMRSARSSARRRSISSAAATAAASSGKRTLLRTSSPSRSSSSAMVARSGPGRSPPLPYGMGSVGGNRFDAVAISTGPVGSPASSSMVDTRCSQRGRAAGAASTSSAPPRAASKPPRSAGWASAVQPSFHCRNTRRSPGNRRGDGPRRPSAPPCTGDHATGASSASSRSRSAAGVARPRTTSVVAVASEGSGVEIARVSKVSVSATPLSPTSAR